MSAFTGSEAPRVAARDGGGDEAQASFVVCGRDDGAVWERKNFGKGCVDMSKFSRLASLVVIFTKLSGVKSGESDLSGIPGGSLMGKGVAGFCQV